MLYYDLEIDKEYVSENYLYKKTQDGLLMKKHCPSRWIKAHNDMYYKDFTIYEQHPYPQIQWDKVQLDDRVLVSQDGINWMNYHFAKFEDDKVYVFANGGTYWSTSANNLVLFLHTKLYEYNLNT